MGIPKRVSDRITQQVKRYQAVIADAKNRDISESDTVRIIADMLGDIFGYNRYAEVTTEFAIRGTYVDLAVKVGTDVRFLVEAKAIGVELKDSHIKQAVDYGVNQGIEWVILTNAVTWMVYKVLFQQPVDKVLVSEIDMLTVSPRNAQLLECFGNLSRERFDQSAMKSFFLQRQVTSRFSVAAMLLSDPVVTTLRRELRRLSPTLRIDDDLLRGVLREEVLKREVVDSEAAKQACDMLRRMTRSAASAKTRAESEPSNPVPAGEAESPPERGATSFAGQGDKP